MPDSRNAELLQQIAERDAALAQKDAELANKDGQLASKDEALAAARSEIALLKQKLDILARRLFGKKSEQLDPRQLQLLFQELEAPGPALGNESGPQAFEVEPARAKRAPRRPRGNTPRLPENLPVIEEVIVPLPVQAAPEDWRKIGEEVSERLDFEPARFLRRRTVRPKFVRRAKIESEAAPVIAPLPSCLQERSLITPGLLTQIVISKYCDHLPLYRQKSIYWSRYQVWLSRQQLALWVGLGADWLRLIHQQIHAEVFAHGYVQIDETPLRYLAPGHGQTKLGCLWTSHRPGPDIVYSWHTSRAAPCLEKIISGDFSGRVQCDGYTAYDAFARTRGDAIELIGCWAHVRRPFFDARQVAPRQAGLILHLIGKLYQCEARLRERRAGAKLRALA